MRRMDRKINEWINEYGICGDSNSSTFTSYNIPSYKIDRLLTLESKNKQLEELLKEAMNHLAGMTDGEPISASLYELFNKDLIKALMEDDK
jgi:hypothetical protein